VVENKPTHSFSHTADRQRRTLSTIYDPAETTNVRVLVERPEGIKPLIKP
jgi:hypothetical protein